MQLHDGRVVSNFIVQALTDQPISIYGHGKQTRSFCYVDDLVDELVRLIDTDDGITAPINFGNPVEFAMMELAETVIELTGSGSSIEFSPLPTDDPRQRQPDISRARNTLVWSPSVQLRDGQGDTNAYFDEMLRGQLDGAT
jgi:UDP-glucuronate decarboxylase